MSSAILSALPTIHTTLIGIGAALFSVIWFNEYKKLEQAKAKIISELKEAQNLRPPTTIHPNQRNVHPDNWEWVMMLVHRASGYFPKSDGIGEFQSARPTAPRDEDLISDCTAICTTFYRLFTTYPFEITLDAIIENSLSQTQISELRERVQFLTWLWQLHAGSLLEFARRASIAEENREQHRLDEEFAVRNAGLSNEDASKRERSRLLFYTHRQVDYCAVIDGSFEKVLYYERTLLPALQEFIYFRDGNIEQRRLKRLTLWMIGIAISLLLIGVVAPLAMESARANFGCIWLPGVEYALLAITMTPYFWICVLLFLQVRRSLRSR